MKIKRNTMNTTLSFLFFTLCMAGQNVFAVNPEMQSGAYNVLTHFVVGTNSKTPKKTLDKELSSALASIRPDFGYDSYSNECSHFQSIGNGGSISFRSMSRRLGSFEVMENPIFSELSFGGFRVDETDAGSLGFKAFSFQARLPIRFKGIDKNPENVSLVNYENIKIALTNITLQLSKPKLIASLQLPDHGETLFIIVEVRKAGSE